MKKQVLKTNFFTSFPYFRPGLLNLAFALCLAFLISCEGEKKAVSGSIPNEPTQPGVTTGIQAPAYVFAGSFQVVNSGFYETLLRTCSRCGTKRLIQTPHGARYERYWSLGESLKECSNWLSEGFLQLEFAQKKLPTSVKVLFQPKYIGSQDRWGHSFELTTEAVAINKNEGFEIIIHPNQGLGGLYSMILSSNSSNHVIHSDLSILVKYGPSGEILMEPSLKEYRSRWVEKPQFSCREYSN